MPRKNDLSSSGYAAPLLSACLRAILKEKDGVRAAKDIEYLHRMRVASRRMRTCLWMFKGLFPGKTRASLRKEIRGITRVLGNARDIDTHLRFLADKGKSSPGSPLLEKALRKERLRLQEKIVTHLARLDGTRLSRLVRQAHGTSSLPLSALLRKKILIRLKVVRGFDRACREKKNIPCLHRMRIAAKHLRYTLEHSRPYFGPSLDRYIREAKELHDFLGDVHNCHLWGEEARASDIPGLSGFIRACQAGERQAYGKFIAAWERQRALKIWDALQEKCR